MLYLEVWLTEFPCKQIETKQLLLCYLTQTMPIVRIYKKFEKNHINTVSFMAGAKRMHAYLTRKLALHATFVAPNASIDNLYQFKRFQSFMLNML